LWFGDEFGPFLLHTDVTGKLLDAPIPLPDFENPGKQVRSPQNPLHEEASAVRIMNALRAHAQKNGNLKAPVFSPWDPMLDAGNPATFIPEFEPRPPLRSSIPRRCDHFHLYLRAFVELRNLHRRFRRPVRKVFAIHLVHFAQPREVGDVNVHLRHQRERRARRFENGRHVIQRLPDLGLERIGKFAIRRNPELTGDIDHISHPYSL
jgi:hypothetical protein